MLLGRGPRQILSGMDVQRVITQLISLGNGFYADDEDNMYFQPTEFLRHNGLPTDGRLAQVAIAEVLELDPAIRILQDSSSGLFD